MRDDFDSGGRSRSTKQTPWEIVRLSEHDVLSALLDASPMLIRILDRFFSLAIFKFNPALVATINVGKCIVSLLNDSYRICKKKKEKKKERKEEKTSMLAEKSLATFEKNS